MNYKNIFIQLAVVCLLAIPLQMAAQGATRDPLRATSSAFFQTDEARHIGDQMLLMKHDGSNDKDKKLVVTDSYFDALSPTPLGRYHHDAQFVLVNCRMSSQILDRNIEYAYIKKQPDPWGLRAFYFNCTREGGNSGWLKNNLNQMEKTPAPHGITARWTFGVLWDPEARIRNLWHVLAY